MNILFTGSFPPHPGGSGVVNGQLLEGLITDGCHLQIVTPTMPENLGRSKIMRDRFSGAELFEFPMDRPQIEPWSDGFESKAAKRQLDTTLRLCEARIIKNPPDLMLVGREASLWGLPELAKQYELPIAVMCHAISFLLSGGAPPEMVRKVLQELDKVDLAIVPANHAAEALIKEGHKNICILPNCVDTELFRPGPRNSTLRQSLHITDNQLVVAHASNLKSVKRAHDIVASAASCLQTNPNLLYLIIGDGPCLKDLQDDSRRYGIEDHFRYTGWVDRDEMPDLLRLADIAVMPSSVEGLAMAYLEAMASGLVIIASDIASAREVIIDGKTGFTFPVGDVEALSRVTLHLAADTDLRQLVGRRARAHMETHYRLEESTRRLTRALISLTSVGNRKCRSGTPHTGIQL